VADELLALSHFQLATLTKVHQAAAKASH